MTSLARATSQFTASACADLVSRVPALEPAFVRVGSRVWRWRRAGHFYRASREDMPIGCVVRAHPSRRVLTPGASNLANGGLSPDRTIRVRTETLDHWLAKDDIERVDLVKIDAEGAEAHVVRGMSGALQAGRVDAVVCETEWDSDAHRLLCGFGFVPQSLDTSGPLTNIAYARPQ